MTLKSDCRHFPGDRPCTFNKLDGTMCDNCSHYSTFKQRILIIKLDATGDVLRTTSLLPAIREKYPDAHISWITRKNASGIFANNPDVNRVIAFEDTDSVLTALAESFDILYHPDASKASGRLAAAVKAGEKYGFGVNQEGIIFPFTENAVEWYEMGAFDSKKKANKKSYQQIIHEICHLEFKGGRIQIHLSGKEKEFAASFRKQHNLDRYKRIIGFNTGAGDRWELKQWRFDGYVELLAELSKIKDLGILLYGGPEEAERNNKLATLFPNVTDTGAHNSLREFFALVELADVFVSGDTLALHAATALQKKIVCLFGPTSYNEIYDYGLIKKLYPDMECLVCYKMRCDFVPNCMDLISTKDILSSLKNTDPIFRGI